MVRTLRKELDVILSWSKEQVASDAKAMKLLKINFPGIWKSIKTPEAPDALKISCREASLVTIKAILAAMKGQKTPSERPLTGLGAEHLIQMAEMLKIEIPKKGISGRKLLNRILKEIKAH